MINPVKEIFDENRSSPVQIEQSKLIKELLIFGTNLLDWELKSSEKSAKFPLIFLIRRTLEILDSISILIRNSNSSTLMMLLRVQIELFFYIEYLIRENTKVRGNCHNYWHLKELKKSYKRLDANTELGKQFLSTHKKDKSSNTQLDLPSSSFLEKKLTDINRRLDHKMYSEIMEEEKRLKGLNIKKPKWYQYYNENTGNIEKLASCLDFHSLYEVNYRLTSRSIHGIDSYEGVFHYNSDGTLDICNIREPVMSLDCAIESSHFALSLYKSYIERRLPKYSNIFNNWFNTRIQDLRQKYLNEKNEV